MDMNKEKMRFWLIQRAEIEPRDQKGIDGLIHLDYMGSAEFEFGSVPKSLKQIRSEVTSYIHFDLPVGIPDPLIPNQKTTDKILTVFCKPEDRADIEEFLLQCCNGKEPQLKERTELNQWAHPEITKWTTRNKFWWDIDNHWMAWEQNPEFTEKVLAQLNQQSLISN